MHVGVHIQLQSAIIFGPPINTSGVGEEFPVIGAANGDARTSSSLSNPERVEAGNGVSGNACFGGSTVCYRSRGQKEQEANERARATA